MEAIIALLAIAVVINLIAGCVKSVQIIRDVFKTRRFRKERLIQKIFQAKTKVDAGQIQEGRKELAVLCAEYGKNSVNKILQEMAMWEGCDGSKTVSGKDSQ